MKLVITFLLLLKQEEDLIHMSLMEELDGVVLIKLHTMKELPDMFKMS